MGRSNRSKAISYWFILIGLYVVISNISKMFTVNEEVKKFSKHHDGELVSRTIHCHLNEHTVLT